MKLEEIKTLEDTLPLMLSNDPKDRILAEYFQLKFRIEGADERLEQLRAICPTAEYEELSAQRLFMLFYKYMLQKRIKRIYAIDMEE
ncbi:MAG: hypothetical protein IJQ82_11840 [Selenomonadaceae bacterium]|nr:hypothetical protein [Selenomonadaceae bacterium]